MTTTTVPTIPERVQAGAAWLDETEPGSVDRIDPDQLDLASICDCILGQIHGDYDDARDARLQGSDYAAASYGFTIWPDHAPDGMNTGEEFAALTEAWRELIAARRAGGAR